MQISAWWPLNIGGPKTPPSKHVSPPFSKHVSHVEAYSLLQWLPHLSLISSHASPHLFVSDCHASFSKNILIYFMYLSVLGLSCSIWNLASWPGIEPRPPELGTLSLSPCTTREAPVLCLVAQSCVTFCDSMDCSPPGSCVHGDSPGKNTGMGCHALLQGIFPIQRSNCISYISCIGRQVLYHLNHQGSSRILEWVAYPFSRGTS